MAMTITIFGISRRKPKEAANPILLLQHTDVAVVAYKNIEQL
jgi:hypothetical protein